MSGNAHQEPQGTARGSGLERKREAEHADGAGGPGGAARHPGAERAPADNQRQPLERVVAEVLDDRTIRFRGKDILDVWRTYRR